MTRGTKAREPSRACQTNGLHHHGLRRPDRNLTAAEKEMDGQLTTPSTKKTGSLDRSIQEVSFFAKKRWTTRIIGRKNQFSPIRIDFGSIKRPPWAFNLSSGCKMRNCAVRIVSWPQRCSKCIPDKQCDSSHLWQRNTPKVQKMKENIFGRFVLRKWMLENKSEITENQDVPCASSRFVPKRKLLT